jgi:hypothetical protein
MKDPSSSSVLACSKCLIFCLRFDSDNSLFCYIKFTERTINFRASVRLFKLKNWEMRILTRIECQENSFSLLLSCSSKWSLFVATSKSPLSFLTKDCALKSSSYGRSFLVRCSKISRSSVSDALAVFIRMFTPTPKKGK